MYEERKEKFSFKSFFLTLLLVLLFIFLMLWLFPTRNYVDTKFSNYDLDRISVLYDEIFYNNIIRMKEAAIGYYTNERMPQEVGKTEKLTLGQMYDLHLVLKMKDKNGKPCDTEKSYVEMTKFTEEYRLKVNLSCGADEDYIIVYLGCYSYCPGGVCEKNVSTPSEKTKQEEQAILKPTPQPQKYYCTYVDGKYYDAYGSVVSKAEYDLSCNVPTPIVKKYMYEYKLQTSDKTTCGDWSKWDKNSITATDLIKVETKTEKEIVDYKTETVQDGYDVTIVKKQERYISGYTTQLVLKETKQVKTGKTTTQQVTEEVQVGTIEVSTNTFGSGTVKPKDTSTTVYKVVSVDTPTSCSYCENETIYTWEIYEVKPVYDVITTTKEVPVYKTVNVFEEEEVPVYSIRTVEEEVKTPKYKDVKVPVYGDVKYYRSKTCTFTKGITDIKWSNTNMDVNLISKGYKLTGNVKEV